MYSKVSVERIMKRRSEWIWEKRETKKWERDKGKKEEERLINREKDRRIKRKKYVMKKKKEGKKNWLNYKFYNWKKKTCKKDNKWMNMEWKIDKEEKMKIMENYELVGDEINLE